MSCQCRGAVVRHYNKIVREWILTAASIPAVAVGALAAGILGIVAEFLLPARVIPGALGGVLALLGLWSLWPQHLVLVLMALASVTLLAVPLLRIAARARRNKLAVK
jgi:membrane-bound ClpP family serine protease